MPSQGIGDILQFGILPIRQVMLTSGTMVSVDERIIIGNLLEGSTFQVNAITRPTQLGTDWILGYNVSILARTAERPHRYFRNGFTSGGGVFLPQFIQAGTAEIVTVSVAFGKATTNVVSLPFTEITMPDRSSSQNFQLQNVSVVTDVVSGADGFLFGEITIKGTIRALPSSGFFLQG